MPIRIQPNRPYYPRYYLPRRAPQPTGGGGKGGGKGAFGGGVDTSSTGNIGGDLAKAVINTMLQNRQNAVANQIMNTQTPPRAGAVGPVVDPTTGQITSNITPTVGTAPQTGGMGELQMRQQMQQQDLADQLQKAKIASELALAAQRTGKGGGGGGGGGGGNAARWQQYLGGGQGGGSAAAGKKAGKPASYEPGSIDANTDPNADKFPVVQADFDAQYGKGAYAKVAPRLGNVVPDDKGNYVVQDDKGNTIVSLPPSDANYWLARVNAARVRSGQQPMLTDKFPSANPNSGQPAGTEVNPYKPANQLEARSLPYNSFFVDPNSGQVGQKLPEEKQAPTGQKTSQVDTGDQGGQLATGDTGDQGAQLAIGDQSVQPPPPDMSTGVGLDQTGGAVPDVGSGSLADAIARAKAQDQLLAA
jgi:hypothetical protein